MSDIFTLRNSFFFFNDTATTEIYTLSLHDALPISSAFRAPRFVSLAASHGRSSFPKYTEGRHAALRTAGDRRSSRERSEEHTSELQSRQYLVCRLLLEKKKKTVPEILIRPCTIHSH